MPSGPAWAARWDPGKGGGANYRIANVTSQPIAALAARQQGNITTEQLLAVGLTYNAIHHRVMTGRLFRVHRGVYSVGKPPTTPLERASAAVLACGQTAALSHGSAMTLWTIWKRWRTPFEVAVLRDRRPRGIRIHRPRTLGVRDITRHLGITVTTPARTVLDCAPRLSNRTLKRAVNEAFLSHYLHQAALADVIDRYPHHPGTRRLLPFIAESSGPTRSQLEDEFLSFCGRYDLPRPETNVLVAGYLVDALFPAERVIVELDGFEFHESRQAFERDRNRDADTLLAGLPTVRITWARMTGRPDREAARLNAILAGRR